MKLLYTITLSALLISCANTNQSVLKTDDELTSTINLLLINMLQTILNYQITMQMML